MTNHAWLTVTAQTYKRRGRKKLGERQTEEGRERPFCPPGMTESLMQKDPTWREVGEWESGRGA